MDSDSPEDTRSSEDIVNLPQSYAFTVTFDNGKQGASAEMPSKFPRRHIRNLSLPIAKVYETKVNTESSGAVNGGGIRLTRRAGNHSEGYFSSDDDSKPKLFEVKHKYSEFKGGLKSTNAAQEKRSSSVVQNELPAVVTVEKEKNERPDVAERGEGEGEEETSSDVASETGTYTIDKDSPEVISARKSIDQVFGIQQANESKNNEMNSSYNSNYVEDWASSVVEHNSHTSLDSNSSSSRNSGVSNSGSKIPSPINLRSRMPPMTQPLRGDHLENLRNPLNRKSYPVAAQDVNTLETESYLRTTERVVSALAARVSLSLDSGGESDAENSLGPAHATDSDSSNTMRYNRAFSLRRGRLEEPKKKVTTPISTAPVVKPKSCEMTKPVPARVNKRDSAPPTLASNFNRTDCGRFSMRTPSARPLPQSPLMSNTKKEVVKKKSGNGASARSNSTLSSKEVEFQNWKRRKSYDPMKAAAEGKKKEAAAKKQPPSVMTQSINSTLTTPKSPVNPVLRSASFHGTRQLVASSSEEDEEIILSAEDEDWPVLQAPKTSLENSPQGSKISLYSNTNSNSPTPPLRNRAKLEGVDTLVISAVSGLSHKLKGSSCNLLNKLRFLYDEDSPKNHRLGAMIDQLEATDPGTGSPQTKSPSRELASTLRNLKRLESMLKVLDDVLFDEEEFQ